MLTGRLFLSALATIALSCAAHASTIAIFNTGVVDGSGILLANGAVDPHYLLTSVPGGTTGIQVLTSTAGYPSSWLGVDSSSVSAWIGPNTFVSDGPAGDYNYRTTFDLTGLDPATASLIGQWSTDNTGVDILINGVSTGITATGPAGTPEASFTQWTTFSIGSGFVGGVNTLDFIVNNQSATGANPTGLRVEISGNAAAAPEPASFVLIGAGLLALSRLRRRVRS
jgi:hypothetical protein